MRGCGRAEAAGHLRSAGGPEGGDAPAAVQQTEAERCPEGRRGRKVARWPDWSGRSGPERAGAGRSGEPEAGTSLGRGGGPPTPPARRPLRGAPCEAPPARPPPARRSLQGAPASPPPASRSLRAAPCKPPPASHPLRLRFLPAGPPDDGVGVPKWLKKRTFCRTKTKNYLPENCGVKNISYLCAPVIYGKRITNKLN